jgi:signal transduction histidine kinase
MVEERIRILFVEDDPDDFILVQEMLSSVVELRYELKWVGAYDEALSELVRHRYDVCLLDYSLGTHSGLELLNQTKRKNSGTAFIFLTGRGDHEMDLDAMRAGAVDFLDKGLISPLLLERSIRYGIARKQSEALLIKAQRESEERVMKRTADLAAANAALKESSDKIKFFAYAVSHDLRSPAVGLLGLARRLFDNYKDTLDETGRTYCEMMMKVANHIASLAENINVFIRTKEAPLAVERVNVKEIFRTIREEFSFYLGPGRINWIEHVSPQELKADKEGILRVLRNLVDNALKYGGTGLSRIEVGCKEAEGFYTLWVGDNGVGLGDEDASKYFQLFVRGKSDRNTEGTGLGLAIVKEIAERHCGKAWAESVPEKGTTFYVSLSKDLSQGKGALNQNRGEDSQMAAFKGEAAGTHLNKPLHRKNRPVRHGIIETHP